MSDVVTRDQMADVLEQRCNAAVRERLGKNWRRVSVLTADQGASNITRTTDFHLLELCVGGNAYSKVNVESETGDDFEATLLPGSLHFLPSNRPVTYDLTGQNSLQQILIDETIFRDAAAAMGPGDPDALHPLAFGGIFESRLKGLADALMDEARAPSLGGDLYAEAVASQIAVLTLRRRHGPPKSQSRRRTLSPTELARVTDHLEANLAETGGIDTLATLVDMDVFAFTRAFKETTGQAPHQYLIDRRMTRIKDMLIHSPDSIAEIAYAAGFSSQSHMTQSFKRRVGSTPAQWRRVAAQAVTA